MTSLLISSLYNPMDNEIDIKIQVFSFFTSLFYNTLLDVLNYNICQLYTYKILMHKKGTSFEVPLCYGLLETCMVLINYISKNMF